MSFDVGVSLVQFLIAFEKRRKMLIINQTRKIMFEGRRTSTKLQKNAMIKALTKTLGVLTKAVEQVGTTRMTHHRWMKEDDGYRKAVEELDEVRLDFVESALFKNIKDGKERSILYFLETKGKERGYVQGPQIHAHVNGLENMTDDEIKQQIKRAGYVEQESQLDSLEVEDNEETSEAE